MPLRLEQSDSTTNPMRSLPSACAALALGTTPALSAQTFQSPGMPGTVTGQTDRFSNEFNPAIGGAFDVVGTWLDADQGEHGLDLSLRSFELAANTWIDPNAWAYAVLVASEEELGLEEAAVHYLGFGSRTTLRAGRFFVDFGKQMQAHVHDLPYTDRPGVLREYLGTELPGTGAQLDHWFPTGDDSALRFSCGVFDSLAGDEHDHGESGTDGGPEIVVPERGTVHDLSFTARLTQFMDAGEDGVFQWGVSGRFLPEFAFEDDDSGAVRDGLSNSVLGLDLTYGLGDETGLRAWTLGGEFLRYSGDIAATAVGPDLDVLDDAVDGYYVALDRKWSARDSAGLLYSAFEHPARGAPSDSELTLYYTRNLTEFSRLRFGVTLADRDEGSNSTLVTVQFTNLFGAHAHGINW